MKLRKVCEADSPFAQTRALDDLAAGRLVRPFELSLPAGFAYYVVYPPRALQRPSVKSFRDWLIAEAR